MKKALICGISGQDGGYLAQLLLNKGYEVFGTSRDSAMSGFRQLKLLGIYDRVTVHAMRPTDFRSVRQVISKVDPDEIYYLAGQSSVGLSFEKPVETFESFVLGALNILEVIRCLKKNIRFYNACSTECFGNTENFTADERTPFCPRSPYGVAKAASYWLVVNYREAYGLYACSGILSNHESPFRPERFVTQKIISAVYRIKQGSKEKLFLGNMDIFRDWGWSPDYVQAIYLMLQQNRPDDFVIASGETYSLKDFMDVSFRQAGLNWQDHVTFHQELLRPTDISISRVNPQKAREVLGWSAQYKMPDVVKLMLDAWGIDEVC